jgi:pyridoxal phosphate enzyme (YggS family)
MTNLRAELIAQSLNQVKEKITNAALSARRSVDDLTLIVVTKTYPVSDVEILHNLGERNFGENRSDEGAEKSAQVNGTWHFQGQVQSRKLRDIAGWATYVHSIDSPEHALKLSRICNELGKDISIFLQLSLDGAPDRGGVIDTEIFALAEQVANLPNIKLAGLMCVPPVTYEHQRAFLEIAQIHERFKSSFPEANSLSAGMSSDFGVAIAHGATHLRIGSQILGSRAHHP